MPSGRAQLVSSRAAATLISCPTDLFLLSLLQLVSVAPRHNLVSPCSPTKCCSVSSTSTLGAISPRAARAASCNLHWTAHWSECSRMPITLVATMQLCLCWPASSPSLDCICLALAALPPPRRRQGRRQAHDYIGAIACSAPVRFQLVQFIAIDRGESRVDQFPCT